MAKKLLKTTSELVLGAVGIGFGASLLGKLPASAATTKVQAGMTTFAGFYPFMATGAATGIMFNQLKGLSKLSKVKRRRK